jgi:NADPH2:quinone reductase
MARTYRRAVIVQALQRVTAGADPQKELESLLFSMLSSREKQVYVLVRVEGVRTSLAAAGALKISINQRYPMADIARAHADLQGGRTTGSSVILP